MQHFNDFFRNADSVHVVSYRPVGRGRVIPSTLGLVAFWKLNFLLNFAPVGGGLTDFMMMMIVRRKLTENKLKVTLRTGNH